MLDIAILEGVRSPFVKVQGPLGNVPAQELGRHVAQAVLERAAVRPDQVDQVVFGNAAIPPDAPNIARVIALLAGVPQERIAHTVHRNCASGMEAITTAAQILRLGEARLILAGGTESMTRIPLLYNEDAVKIFVGLMSARSAWQRATTFLRFRPKHLLRPVIAIKQGLTDPVSGLLMGETAELLVEEFGISRREQDEFALESHRRAVDAQKRGLLAEEIAPVPAALAGQEVRDDVGPRPNQSLEALAKLKPVFKEGGTLTVGNSCGLTMPRGAATYKKSARRQAARQQNFVSP